GLVRPIAGDTVIETPASDTIRISSKDAQDMLVKIIEALAKSGVQMESVSVNPPTLEEVFLTVVDGARSSS
ncbi:MAG TPA: multidrug ABC transporter ATP-binding protein, partial [Nitrososphaera sp.]